MRCLNQSWFPCRLVFNDIAVLFNDYTKQIPLTFLLGFYVALIVKRWWEQFECVAWPDDLLRLFSDVKILRQITSDV